MPNSIILPKSGQTVTFVDRAKMKANGRVKRATPQRKVAGPPAPPPVPGLQPGPRDTLPAAG